MKSFNFNSKSILISFLFIMLLGNISLSASVDDDNLLSTKISIDAEDGSVSHIISTMAVLSNCNIVLALETSADDQDDVREKKLTIHLKEVPIEQALSLVVKSIGLSYRLIGEKTFIVGEKDRIEEEVGERSYVINLNYIDASKVIDALEILPGQAVAIDGQNSILVRANPESFAEISKKIEEIDLPRKQIEIKARLIEISISEAEKVGIDWSKLDHLTTIMAEDPVTADGQGLPYNYNDLTSPHGDEAEFGVIPEEQYFQKMDDWSDILKFSRQLYAFDVTIDWLLENNAAQLLTDTRVTAMNGEEAEIHIGEVVPFVVLDDDNNIQVERENVGIILKIKPYVNSEGLITTRIEPQVSSVIELVNGSVPRTKVRKALTTVTVPDGRRIIVGGLLSSTISKKTNKLPILGDLPFIGKLFQHRYEVIENTDLIIEITPRVVSFEDEVEIKVDERLERELIERN